MYGSVQIMLTAAVWSLKIRMTPSFKPASKRWNYV